METLNKYILLFHSFHFADHASRLNFVSLHSQCTFIESNTRESIATTSNYEHCGLYDYFYLSAIPVWMREAYWLLVSASQQQTAANRVSQLTIRTPQPLMGGHGERMIYEGPFNLHDRNNFTILTQKPTERDTMLIAAAILVAINRCVHPARCTHSAHGIHFIRVVQNRVSNRWHRISYDPPKFSQHRFDGAQAHTQTPTHKHLKHI